MRYYVLLDSGVESAPLPVGHMTYPFDIQLPTNIPASFESTHGNVRYWLECKVNRPWMSDYKCQRPLGMRAVLDLNWVPNARVSSYIFMSPLALLCRLTKRAVTLCKVKRQKSLFQQMMLQILTNMRGTFPGPRLW